MILTRAQANSLSEKIAYEKYVALNSLQVVSSIFKFDTVTGIEYVDHKYSTHILMAYESLGADKVKDFIEDNLLPLLFITSYKMLDMVIECIFNINNINNIPGNYEVKYIEISKLLNDNKLIFPNMLTAADWSNLIETYGRLRLFRNIIIHRKGLVFQNGDMYFNNGADCITKEQVIAFTSCMHIVTELLLSDIMNVYYDAMENTFKKEMLKLSPLLGSNYQSSPYNTVEIRFIYYNISNSGDDLINLTDIRQKISANNVGNETIHYIIEVNRCGELWSIPSLSIPDTQDEICLKDYDSYKK